LTGVYTVDVPLDSKGQPVLAKCQLTSTQAEILRLAARIRSAPSSNYFRTPESSGPDGEDSVDEFYRENPSVPKFSDLVKIRNPAEDEKAFTAQMLKDSRERLGKNRTLPRHPMATRSSDAVPKPKSPATPVSVPPDPPSPKSSRAKAPPKLPVKTKVPPKASRAGSLRPGVGGSGQTDTCVASSHPSQTRVRNLFLRGGFFPLANPAEFNGTA
jgi:hypothetical protein